MSVSVHRCCISQEPNSSRKYVLLCANSIVLIGGQRPYHDDDIKWKHFLRHWPFVRGIHRSPVDWSAPEQAVEQIIETPVIWDGAQFDVTVVMWSNKWWCIDGQVWVLICTRPARLISPRKRKLIINVLYWILKRSSDFTGKRHPPNLIQRPRAVYWLGAQKINSWYIN